MTNISAPRDDNRVPTLIGVSNADGVTPVVPYVDSVTHRLLVDGATGGTPGGNNTDVQFNNGGSFGGSDNFTYNSTTHLLTVQATTVAFRAVNTIDSTVVEVARLEGAKPNPNTNDAAYLSLQLSDSNHAQQEFSRVSWIATDKTAGTIDGALKFSVPINNTLNDILRIEGQVVSPNTNGLSALGSTSLNWADLFLDNGGVINWNNSDVTITHAANSLTFAGASSGYAFDSLVSGSTASFITGSFTNLTAGTGTITSLTGTTIVATIGSFNNLLATTGTIVSLTGTTHVATTGSFTNLFATTGTVVSLTGTTNVFTTTSATNLLATTGTIVSLTGTTHVAVTGSFTNFLGTNGTMGNLFATTGSFSNLIVTTGTVVSLTGTTHVATTGSFTNLFATTGTVVSLTGTTNVFTTSSATNLFVTNGTIVSLTGTTHVATTGSFTNLLTTTGTIVSLTGTTHVATTGSFTNLFATSATIPVLNITSSTAFITQKYVAGQTLAAYQPVYMQTNGQWALAIASTPTLSSGLIGMAVASANNGATATVAMKNSVVQNAGWSWTIGTTIFLATTTSGFTATPTATANFVIRVAGFAMDTTTMYFSPSEDYLTHT